MRLNRLDLNLLVCFDALLSEKNVSRAAARVFLSQPAMSVALRRLREHFNDELLVQVGRAYELTPFAQSLQKPVRDVLIQMRAIGDLRPTFDPAQSTRKITIEVSDYVANVFMGPVFRSASELAPRMRFDLRILGARYLEDLDSGAVDLLIIPTALASSDHPKEVLFTDKFCCAVWSKNDRVGPRITREQYFELEHVVSEWDGGRATSLAATAVPSASADRPQRITVPSFSLTPQFVIGTQRIATVQLRLAQLMATRWPIRLLPCPVETPEIVEAVQWHRHHGRDAAITWFVQLLRSVARQMDDSLQPVPGSLVTRSTRGSGRRPAR